MTNLEGKIGLRINKAIQDKVFPGCVVGVVKKNGERKIWPFGRFTYGSDSAIVKEDTIYGHDFWQNWFYGLFGFVRYYKRNRHGHALKHHLSRKKAQR